MPRKSVLNSEDPTMLDSPSLRRSSRVTTRRASVQEPTTTPTPASIKSKRLSFSQDNSGSTFAETNTPKKKAVPIKSIKEEEKPAPIAPRGRRRGSSSSEAPKENEPAIKTKTTTRRQSLSEKNTAETLKDNPSRSTKNSITSKQSISEEVKENEKPAAKGRRRSSVSTETEVSTVPEPKKAVTRSRRNSSNTVEVAASIPEPKKVVSTARARRNSSVAVETIPENATPTPEPKRITRGRRNSNNSVVETFEPKKITTRARRSSVTSNHETEEEKSGIKLVGELEEEIHKATPIKKKKADGAATKAELEFSIIAETSVDDDESINETKTVSSTKRKSIEEPISPRKSPRLSKQEKSPSPTKLLDQFVEVINDDKKSPSKKNSNISVGSDGSFSFHLNITIPSTTEENVSQTSVEEETQQEQTTTKRKSTRLSLNHSQKIEQPIEEIPASPRRSPRKIKTSHSESDNDEICDNLNKIRKSLEKTNLNEGEETVQSPMKHSKMLENLNESPTKKRSVTTDDDENLNTSEEFSFKERSHLLNKNVLNDTENIDISKIISEIKTEEEETVLIDFDKTSAEDSSAVKLSKNGKEDNLEEESAHVLFKVEVDLRSSENIGNIEKYYANNEARDRKSKGTSIRDGNESACQEKETCSTLGSPTTTTTNFNTDVSIIESPTALREVNEDMPTGSSMSTKIKKYLHQSIEETTDKDVSSSPSKSVTRNSNNSLEDTDEIIIDNSSSPPKIQKSSMSLDKITRKSISPQELKNLSKSLEDSRSPKTLNKSLESINKIAQFNEDDDVVMKNSTPSRKSARNFADKNLNNTQQQVDKVDDCVPQKSPETLNKSLTKLSDNSLESVNKTEKNSVSFNEEVIVNNSPSRKSNESVNDKLTEMSEENLNNAQEEVSEVESSPRKSTDSVKSIRKSVGKSPTTKLLNNTLEDLEENKDDDVFVKSSSPTKVGKSSERVDKVTKMSEENFNNAQEEVFKVESSPRKSTNRKSVGKSHTTQLLNNTLEDLEENKDVVNSSSPTKVRKSFDKVTRKSASPDEPNVSTILEEINKPRKSIEIVKSQNLNNSIENANKEEILEENPAPVNEKIKGKTRKSSEVNKVQISEENPAPINEKIKGKARKSLEGTTKKTRKSINSPKLKNTQEEPAASSEVVKYTGTARTSLGEYNRTEKSSKKTSRKSLPGVGLITETVMHFYTDVKRLSKELHTKAAKKEDPENKSNKKSEKDLIIDDLCTFVPSKPNTTITVAYSGEDDDNTNKKISTQKLDSQQKVDDDNNDQDDVIINDTETEVNWEIKTVEETETEINQPNFEEESDLEDQVEESQKKSLSPIINISDSEEIIEETVEPTTKQERRQSQKKRLSKAATEEKSDRKSKGRRSELSDTIEDFEITSDVEEKINALVAKAVAAETDSEDSDDHEDDKHANSFIDDAAEEGEEDTPSEGSNDIVEVGESLNTTDSESETDESYEEDSFLCDDEEHELLSGEEYDLGDIKKPKKTRIINIEKATAGDDSDIIRIKRKTKEATPTKKLKTRIITVSDSSDDDDEEKEIIETKQENEEKKKDVPIIEDKPPVNSPLLFQKNLDNKGNLSINQTSTPLNNTSLNNSTNKKREQSNRKSSITIQENIRVDEIRDAALSDRINKVVDLFCSGIKSKGEVSLNVSLDYAHKSSPPEHINILGCEQLYITESGLHTAKSICGSSQLETSLINNEGDLNNTVSSFNKQQNIKKRSLDNEIETILNISNKKKKKSNDSNDESELIKKQDKNKKKKLNKKRRKESVENLSDDVFNKSKEVKETLNEVRKSKRNVLPSKEGSNLPVMEEIVKNENKKRNLRAIALRPTVAAETSWTTEYIDLKPSIKPKTISNVRSNKKDRNEKPSVTNRSFEDDKNIHKKDFKLQMIYDNARNVRVDTKKLLKKKGGANF